MDLKKIVYIAPHLSSGGLPQYLLKKIGSLLGKLEIYVIEWANLSDEYVVQKNKIRNLLGDKLITIRENKHEIIEVIKKINPEIVHFEEIPEMFMPDDITELIYSGNYEIYETTHSSDFKVEDKRFIPDKFIFVCPFSLVQYAHLGAEMEVVEYPILENIKDKTEERKKLRFEGKNIVIVGLFTPRKNQKYAFDLAKRLPDVKFHFIGNMAPNFAHYWKPLLESKPDNCIIWGERSDVSSFLTAADISLFPSLGQMGDKELNPLVIKESIEAKTPIFLFNLDVYLGRYDNHPLVNFLTGNIENDVSEISKFLEINYKPKELSFRTRFEPSENKICLTGSKDNVYPGKLFTVIKDLNTDLPIFNCELDFKAWHDLYIIPIPYNVLAFEKVDGFAGFNIEFYHDGKLLKIEELKVDHKKNGLKFAADLTDSPYLNYYEFFIREIYNFVDFSNTSQVIDIGANIGLFSRYCKSKGVNKIISYEPTDKAFKYLELNKFDGQILHKKAVSKENGSLKLYKAKNNSGISSIKLHDWMKDFGEIEEENVPCVTLEEALGDLNEYSRTMVKMDIEGAEYGAFESLSDNKLSLVDQWLLEFHGNDNGQLDKILNRFSKNGFMFNIYKTITGELVKSNISHGFVHAVKTPKEAIVTFCNEKYIPLAKRLVESVNLFCPDLSIIVYGMNCEINFNAPNLIKQHVFDTGIPDAALNKTETFKSFYSFKEVSLSEGHFGIVNRDKMETFKMLTSKFGIICDAIHKGLKLGYFLDADGIINENFEEYRNCEIDNYPVASKRIHEFMFYNDNGDPTRGQPSIEQPLSDLLGVAKRTCPPVTSNFFIFNDHCLDFFRECIKTASLPEISTNCSKYAPFQDETIINVCLWARNAERTLPLAFYNLIDFKNLMRFETEYRNKIFLNSEWQYIPEKKSDIAFFHGCKDLVELDKCLNYLKNKNTNYLFCASTDNKNKIAIVTFYSKETAKLAGVSIKNKKDYCQKHGYDFYVFDIDLFPDKTPWNKVYYTLKVLKNYKWVFWTDIDALIMNQNKKLEDFTDNNSSLVFTSDGTTELSGGHFLVKNDIFGKAFLSQALTFAEKYSSFPYDQGGFTEVYNSSEEIRSRTKILRQKEMNSYYHLDDPEVLKVYPDWNTEFDIYEEGDFIVHFTGYNYNKRLELMEKLA